MNVFLITSYRRVSLIFISNFNLCAVEGKIVDLISADKIGYHWSELWVEMMMLDLGNSM